MGKTNLYGGNPRMENSIKNFFFRWNQEERAFSGAGGLDFIGHYLEVVCSRAKQPRQKVPYFGWISLVPPKQ